MWRPPVEGYPQTSGKHLALGQKPTPEPDGYGVGSRPSFFGLSCRVRAAGPASQAGPRRNLTATAWARERACSFASRCRTCDLTVSSERNSIRPISRLTRPSEISWRTSISRAVGSCSSSLNGAWNGMTSALPVPLRRSLVEAAGMVHIAAQDGFTLGSVHVLMRIGVPAGALAGPPPHSREYGSRIARKRAHRADSRRTRSATAPSRRSCRRPCGLGRPPAARRAARRGRRGRRSSDPSRRGQDRPARPPARGRSAGRTLLLGLRQHVRRVERVEGAPA